MANEKGVNKSQTYAGMHFYLAFPFETGRDFTCSKTFSIKNKFQNYIQVKINVILSQFDNIKQKNNEFK